MDALARKFIESYLTLDKSRIITPFDSNAEIIRMPLTTIS